MRLVLILVGALAISLPAHAEDSLPVQIGHKLVRGAVNVATGWLEMPKQIYRVGREQGIVKGMIQGPIEGLGMVAVRSTAGAYEIVTFLLPVPPGYRPLFQPEYVWQPDPAEADASPLIPPDSSPAP